ncbi:MAG: hypothetical protein U1D69_12235, partial [Polynucleobacter sp.]|nr:hypothetical protein [Polynucleobacter sp.]
MKEQHLAYFRDIGMSRAAISRAIDLHDLLQRVSPIDVEDVFVNDIISEEGVRTQESLWLFGENRVSEFKNMLTVVNFDFLN